MTISLPETLSPAAFSNAEWDRGVSLGPTAELMLDTGTFGRLLIKTGDEILISPTDRRTIKSITSVGNSKVLGLDGAPIRLAGGDRSIFAIARK